MTKNKPEDITLEEDETEEEPKEENKKKKKNESVEKRKKAKAKDVIERWSGMIFLLLVLLVGILLWVGSELGTESSGGKVPPRSGSGASAVPKFVVE